MQFMDRYCLRIAINAACFVFMLAPGTREYGFLVIPFMFGLIVGPWIQLFEDRHKGMQTQMEAATEAVRLQQRREISG